MITIKKNPNLLESFLLNDDVFKPFNSILKNTGLNVWEDEKTMSIDFELAGIGKDNIKIDLEDGVLFIKGEIGDKKKEYCYDFNLYDNLNIDEIKASYVDGVLKVTIEKIEPVKNRREISIS
jgi:HSP20 family protein